MSAKVNQTTFNQQPTLTVGMEIVDSSGVKYTVRGFLKAIDESKAAIYNGSAILQRGNGKVAYSLPVTGTRQMWNRNIISAGMWTDNFWSQLIS